MSVNVKSNHLVRELHFQVTYFIGLFNFEWYSQNEVDNIGILVLWRVCEKLSWTVNSQNTNKKTNSGTG